MDDFFLLMTGFLSCRNTYVTSGATLSHLPSAPGGITAGSMERETKQFQEAFFLYLRNNMVGFIS